jgi:serine/threonine-protein kinase
MAPEQIRSAKSVDTRTDIWALGVILYELLSDAPPFDADNLATLSAQICIDPPVALRERRPSVPAELAAVVEKCLAKQPSARYRDLGELSRALQPFAPEHARVLVERIGRLSRSMAFDETLPARAQLTSTPGAAAAETANATATTVAAPGAGAPPRSGALPLASVVALGAVVVVGLSWLVLRGSEQDPVAPPGAAPTPPVPAAVATPPSSEPSAPASAPAPEPAAPPSASAVASAPRRASRAIAKPAAKPCSAGQVLSNGHCCPLGLVWQGTRCDRPLATKF